MIDMQTAFVTDHVAGLAHEAAALRAERERDHVREHAARGTDPTDHPADLPPPRVRIGRWLVAFGESIAGGPGTVTTMSRSRVDDGSGHDSGGDGDDRLAPAA